MHASSKLAKAVRFALISTTGFATLATSIAYAAGEGDKVERIQVTGSRIQRTDLETANPITVFDAKDIENTGVSTVSEFLRTNAASGGFNESSTLSQAAGASSVGLRGFSSDFTLILLNGHRLPKNSAGGIFTDINQIPLAAVQRIDILPDGASAIYGSDAVAGVINIITKKDFEGLALSAKYGAAVKTPDGHELNVSVVAGTSNDKTNLLFTAEHFQRSKILAKDRKLGGTAFIPGHPGGEGRSTFGIPGFTIISNNGSTIDAANFGSRPWKGGAFPGSPGCPARNPDDPANPNTGTRCRYDFAPLYQLQPESERQSIFTQLTHQATDDLTLTGQFRFSRAYTLTSNAPAPGIIDVSNSPFLEKFLRDDFYRGNATAADQVIAAIKAGQARARVGRRYLDFPNRQKDNTNQTFEAVAGLTYNIDDNWGVDFSLGHSRLTNSQIGAGGQLLVSELERAFNSPNSRFNPFIQNDCNSATLRDPTTNRSRCDALQAAIHRTGEYSVNFATLTFSGLTPLELPGGEVGVATGIDTRRESYQDRSDPATVDGQVVGGAGSNGGGDFENKAIFAEFSLPILEELELNLAARYDKADWKLGDDSKATYSAKVSYRPIDELLLRASFGTGFKAPNLADLFTSVSQGVNNGIIDTRRCNEEGNGDPNNLLCQTTTINSRSGGNPNLTSETSKSYNVGAVYQFTDDISASVDYWSLNIDNIVGSLSSQEILNEEANGNLTNLVVRDNGSVDSGSNGYVLSNLQNLNEESGTGLTYSFDFASELANGDLSANVKIEQFLSRKSQTSANQPLCDDIKDDAARKYRVNAGVTYGVEDLELSANMRFLPGFDNYNQRNTLERTCELIGYYGAKTRRVTENGRERTVYENKGTPQKVASYFQMDLKATYTLAEDNSVTLGIRNLLDRQPPFGVPRNWPFYEQGTFDNIGRFVYLQVDSKF